MTAAGAARESDLNSLSLLTAGVVLATVTMTFGAMIAVFFYRSQGQLWGHIAIPSVLWVSTALLVASSVTLEKARRSLAMNDQLRAFGALRWTAGLAGGFLLGQGVAWLQVLRSGILLARNPHSWFIFLFTALHGLHILLGVGGIAYLLFRTREPASGRKYQMKTRVVANGVSLFWHYLDLLWLVLFGLLLTWRR